jgi:hypothetical protein
LLFKITVWMVWSVPLAAGVPETTGVPDFWAALKAWPETGVVVTVDAPVAPAEGVVAALGVAETTGAAALAVAAVPADGIVVAGTALTAGVAGEVAAAAADGVTAGLVCGVAAGTVGVEADTTVELGWLAGTVVAPVVLPIVGVVGNGFAQLATATSAKRAKRINTTALVADDFVTSGAPRVRLGRGARVSRPCSPGHALNDDSWRPRRSPGQESGLASACRLALPT